MTFYAADFFFLKIGTLCFAVFESFPLIPPRKALPYPDKQFFITKPALPTLSLSALPTLFHFYFFPEVCVSLSNLHQHETVCYNKPFHAHKRYYIT